MKKIQKILGVAAALVALVSCAKEVFNPIEINSKTTEYTVEGGSQVAIPYTIAELGNAEFKATISCSNPLVEIENTIIKENGVMVVTAPSCFFENSCKITLKARDEANNRDAEKTYDLTITPDGVIKTVAANCFVASPGAYLMVPAKKGFGGNVVNADSLGLVWQDDSTLVEFVEFDAKKENIILQFTPDVQGNAVIAAYDSKKAVQWSWHFWVLENKIADVEVTDTTTKLAYKIMDRNVGAISAGAFDESSIGTVYQWGRKDAFAGQNYENGLKKMYAFDEKGNVVEVSRKLENCIEINNIANAIANPMTVYKQDYSAASKGNYSWLTTDYSALDADLLNNLWGGANGKKSVYDPCPEGYRVAPKVVFDAVKTMLEKQDGMIIDNTYVAPEEISSKWQEKYKAQNEKKVQFRGGQFGDAVFMVSGDISQTLSCSNGVTQLQPSAECWSANLDDFSKGKSYFRVLCCKINASFPTTTSPVEDFYMSVNAANALNLGYELPVRCIKAE